MNPTQPIPQPATGQAGRQPDQARFRSLSLSNPWPETGGHVSINACYTPSRWGGPLSGRGSLIFTAGSFCLNLDPTARELRALALLLTACADDLDAGERRITGKRPEPTSLNEAVRRMVAEGPSS